MSSYKEWNQAIIRYFINEATPGTAVFLSVEPIVLADVARLMGAAVSPGDAEQDFCEAVRARCLRRSGRIDGGEILSLCSATDPGQAAFLSALVLAAYKMQEDDEAGISERCYYVRLAEVFGVHQTNRLAMGFAFADEAEDRRAWEYWNRFLAAQGYKSTARAGTGAWTYVRYAESQTLLRMSDQEWLEQLFLQEMQRHKLSQYFSKDQLGSWLRGAELNSSALFRRRIGDLIKETDPRRRDAFLAQAYAIYTDCDPSVSEPERAGRWSSGQVRRAATRIDAGLLRRVRLGRPAEYLVYPQSPAARPVPMGALAVGDGDECPLEPDERPGWCRPLWPAPAVLNKVVLGLRDAGTYTTLLFPERSIWPLVRDPMDADSSDRASWEEPTPGEPFVALVRTQRQASMQLLRTAGLIDWRWGPNPADSLLGWDEYLDCQVVQTVWSQSAVEVGCDEEIYEALRPGKQERVTLQGGLRYPGVRSTWLAGGAPVATGYASCEPLKLCLRRYDRPSEEVSQPVNSGTSWALGQHAAEPGLYELSLVHAPLRGADRVLAEVRFGVEEWDLLTAGNGYAAGVGDDTGLLDLSSAGGVAS